MTREECIFKKETCASCVFFHAHENWEVCRRFPPTHQEPGVPTPVTGYPWLGYKQLACGEYRQNLP